MSIVKLAYYRSAHSHYEPSKIWELVKLAADNFFRDRATLMLHDGAGNVLVSNQKPGFNKSPYYFPGGGVYKKESPNNPIPSNDIVNKGLGLEAKEELGYKLRNVEDFGHQPHERVMPESWQNKSIKKRGFRMQGIRDHFRAAQIDSVNNKLYSSHGDPFYKNKPNFVSAKEVADNLRNHANSGAVSEANKASMLAHANFLDQIHTNYGNSGNAPDSFTQIAHKIKTKTADSLPSKRARIMEAENKLWRKYQYKGKVSSDLLKRVAKFAPKAL
jgi:hypothetical protein